MAIFPRLAPYARLLTATLAILGTASIHPVCGQTACGASHTEPGAFICDPQSAPESGMGSVPDIFHFSAQANALPGRLIRRYTVLLDGKRVYENKLALPSSHLSIETNIESPYHSGSHSLSLSVDAAGTDEVNGVSFHPASHLGFCDQFSRLEAHACVPQRNSTPLDWQPAVAANSAGLLRSFSQTLARFGQNLARLQADTADAIAVEDAGNLYTASHSSSDIEIRRYRRDGSISYDHLVRLCGPGFVSLTALALGPEGRLWIAGNTTACLGTTPGALVSEVTDRTLPHAFLLSLDTRKPGDSSLIYSTWLSKSPASVSALHVDSSGQAYVTGDTTTPEFPNSITIGHAAVQADHPAASFGFLAVVNASGSAFLSSSLFPNTRLNGLALDPSGTVYVTGRTRRPGSPDALLIAGLIENGRKLIYRARLRTFAVQEGRAIAVTRMASHPLLLVAGSGARPFAVALQPCRTGRARIVDLSATADSAPEIAWQPALGSAAAAAATWGSAGTGRVPGLVVDEAPACSAVH